jgi:pimeloyl-ACP methyl ester carboxylesterase
MNRRDLLRGASALALGTCLPVLPTLAAEAKATKLVLVHGIAQQGRDPQTIKKEWLDALEKGLGRPLAPTIDVALPFYGDVLAGFARQLNVPLTSEIHARGDETQDEFLRFQAELADDLRQGAGVTDAQIDAEYGNDPQERGPLNWKWVQAILRAIDKSSPSANAKAIETFTRDVFLYTRRAGVRDAIDEIVSGSLTDQPTVVVGHSLGSVVAFSVLGRDTRTLHVPLYLTVGSPLGVRAVRDEYRPLRRPKPITNWYNAFDTHDVVALYPLDDTNFPVRPPIDNNSTVTNGTDNRHGISGYLNDKKVGAKIAEFLAT